MANFNLRRITAVLAVAVVIGGSSSVTAQQGAGAGSTIGEFSISPFGQIEYRNKPNGNFLATVVGVNGRPVLVKSQSYDLTAPRIELEFTGKKLKPTRIVATGSVKIVNRNGQTGQKTIITTDEMRFSATADPQDRGVMRLVGNVRSETQDSRMAAPFVITGDTGTARFATDGEIIVTINATGNNGTLSGKVYEPAATAKGRPQP